MHLENFIRQHMKENKYIKINYKALAEDTLIHLDKLFRIKYEGLHDCFWFKYETQSCLQNIFMIGWSDILDPGGECFGDGMDLVVEEHENLIIDFITAYKDTKIEECIENVQRVKIAE
uniref:Uncharacterized protein n=1 Tax=Marseillevirus LCMAC102 TaxID=2506603 RepID=A0A481YSS1_9VIRU|nr:MAG: hypothetical protein LCMAC102_01280 [Marseillevirus LCMAC102]